MSDEKVTSFSIGWFIGKLLFCIGITVLLAVLFHGIHGLLIPVVFLMLFFAASVLGFFVRSAKNYLVGAILFALIITAGSLLMALLKDTPNTVCKIVLAVLGAAALALDIRRAVRYFKSKKQADT